MKVVVLRVFLSLIAIYELIYSKSIGECPSKLRSTLLKHMEQEKSVLKSQKCATKYVSCMEKKINDLNPTLRVRGNVQSCNRKLKSNPIPKIAEDIAASTLKVITYQEPFSQPLQEFINYVCCLSRVASKNGGLSFNVQMKMSKDCLRKVGKC